MNCSASIATGSPVILDSRKDHEMMNELRYFLGGGLLDVGIALLIVLAGWFVALLLGRLVSRLVRTIGDERITRTMGVVTTAPQPAPSRVAGTVVRTAILLFVLLEAFEIIGFNAGADLITRFLTFGGDVLLGIAVLCLALYLGRIARDAVGGSVGRRYRALGPVTQGAIVGLGVFMALDQMGVASDIVRLLFVFTAGALAVAAALAFGLGCRESAGRLFDEWVQTLRADRRDQDDG
jgi:hypothetical protein